MMQLENIVSTCGDMFISDDGGLPAGKPDSILSKKVEFKAGIRYAGEDTYKSAGKTVTLTVK